MKKLLTTSLVLSVALLASGCTTPPTDLLTPSEDSIFETLEMTNSCNKYGTVYRSLAKREEVPRDSPTSLCPLAPAIYAADVLKCNKDTKFDAVYEKVYGKPLSEMCGLFSPPSDVPVHPVKASEEISYKLIDELIEASKDCNRAKIKLILLTDEKSVLTEEEDGKEVRAIINQCKRQKLEETLNE